MDTPLKVRGIQYLRHYNSLQGSLPWNPLTEVAKTSVSRCWQGGCSALSIA